MSVLRRAMYLIACFEAGDEPNVDNEVFENCLVARVRAGDVYYVPIGAPHMVLTYGEFLDRQVL